MKKGTKSPNSVIMALEYESKSTVNSHGLNHGSATSDYLKQGTLQDCHFPDKTIHQFWHRLQKANKIS